MEHGLRQTVGNGSTLVPEVDRFCPRGGIPCLFVHEARNTATSVHGDDFTSAGPRVELDWLESQLEGEYELRKGGLLAPGDQDAKEILVLNRAIR